VGHRSARMSAPGTVRQQALLALAAWDAGGEVPF
jgi:hypothetical protein